VNISIALDSGDPTTLSTADNVETTTRSCGSNYQRRFWVEWNL